jgi:hypothetical protein
VAHVRTSIKEILAGPKLKETRIIPISIPDKINPIVITFKGVTP